MARYCDSVGFGVQPLRAAMVAPHVSNATCCDTPPPAYGSSWSSTPWNETVGIGTFESHVRGGRYADTGAVAANTRARSHESRSVIAPP